MKRSILLALAVSCLLLCFAVMAFAAVVTEWYCPKCGSTEVTERMKPEPTTTQRKSMDEYRGGFNTSTTLEYRSHTFILRCERCGYTVEVTQ